MRYILKTPNLGCFFKGLMHMKAQYGRFSTPLLNENIIQRIKITADIDRLSRRGILFIHSPAGYGKTTAVALWARRKNVNAVCQKSAF
jgi:ATP/maltotriose-dependent transcriptional regulator MalT